MPGCGSVNWSKKSCWKDFGETQGSTRLLRDLLIDSKITKHRNGGLVLKKGFLQLLGIKSMDIQRGLDAHPNGAFLIFILIIKINENKTIGQLRLLNVVDFNEILSKQTPLQNRC